MILSQWGADLSNSFNNVLYGAANFLPMLVLAIVIFIIGWFVGGLIGVRIFSVRVLLCGLT